MKTTKVLASMLVLASFLFAFGQANANVNEGNLVKVEGKLSYSIQSFQSDNTFILGLDNQLGRQVKISIYDSKHQLVFSETEARVKSRKKYDLSEFGSDTYTLKLEAGDVKYEEDVVLEAGKFLFNAKFDAVIAPDQHNANKVHMGFANASSDVTFSIYNQYGNLVYKNTYSSVHYMSQKFNLEALKPGIYDIKINSLGFSKEISYAVTQ